MRDGIRLPRGSEEVWYQLSLASHERRAVLFSRKGAAMAETGRSSVTIPATRRSTRSAASAGSRSFWPCAKRLRFCKAHQNSFGGVWNRGFDIVSLEDVIEAVTADFAIFAIGCRGMACGFGRPPPRSEELVVDRAHTRNWPRS